MTREQQQRTKIKICGLKRPEDITYVNEAKPDYCGFIIEFPKSSRNVTGALVRELTAKLNPDIIPVGIFEKGPHLRRNRSCWGSIYEGDWKYYRRLAEADRKPKGLLQRILGR